MPLIKWKNFSGLPSWYIFVDSYKSSFNFKSGNFFNYDVIENFKQHGIFFSKYMPASPKDKSTMQCPLGNLQRRSLLLDPELFFAPTEEMIRQGDLVKFNVKLKNFHSPDVDHAVVVSHTCDVQNKNFILVAPAYFKNGFYELEKDLKERLPSFYENTRTNKVMHFIPYLPYDGRNEELIIDLRQVTAIRKEDVLRCKAINSLSLQGLFYFQNRLAISQIRDLKNRDDLRVLKK